jgi:hypothetical protein
LSPLDHGVLILSIVGCNALGARIGSVSGTKGLKGYFLGESDIPGWAVTVSIVDTETSVVTFLSRGTLSKETFHHSLWRNDQWPRTTGPGSKRRWPS